MAIDSPWFRLNADWMLTPWVDRLGYPCKGIVPILLGHMKLHGNGRGQCKAMPAAMFARMYDVPAGDFDRMMSAAIEAGAIIADDAKWSVSNWVEYQSPDAIKKRNQRDAENVPDKTGQTRNVPDKTGQVPIVPDSPASRASRTTRHDDDDDKTRDPDIQVSATVDDARTPPPGADFLPSRLPVNLCSDKVRDLWQRHEAFQRDAGGRPYSGRQVAGLVAAIKAAGFSEPQLVAWIDAQIGMGKRVITVADVRPILNGKAEPPPLADAERRGLDAYRAASEVAS